MKIQSYKEYKSNGFSLKYYNRIINVYGVQRTVVIAYCDGRRMKDFAGEEKYALRSIICRLADEQRAAETEKYIKEQAARMGVSEYVIKAHIEEVERKKMKATVQAEKPEITAEDIALYDYAMGGAPVEGYTITCAETILKSMKKAGITPAAVERARKKINKEKKAAAPVVEAPAADAVAAPAAEPLAVVWTDDMDNAIANRTADACPLPAWAVDGVRCVYDHRDYGKSTGTASRFHWSAVGHCWLCDFTNDQTLILGALVERMAPAPAAPTSEKTDTTPASEKTDTTPTSEKTTAADDYLLTGAYPIWYERNLQIEHVYNRGKYMGTATENIGTIASWGRKQIKVAWVTGKKNVYTIRDFFELVESGKFIVSMPYDAEYMASLKQPTPAEQKTAPTDAEVMETAARIRANYEAMQADIEAEREQSAAAFAEAITAYCEELSRPEPLAWEPETIIIPFEPRPAAEVEQPRRRHRLNLRPRLSRWLHPVRWVAVAFVVCLLSGLLLGMNTSTAAADDIAAVYELHPVTVTAEAPDTFIEDEAPCLIEDKAPCLIEDKAPCLIEDKAPCLIEDKAPAPSPVKKLAAPSPVKNVAEAAECSSQKTDAADSPAGEKTASPMATATDAAGLTICEGTPWAYTMMNWA